MLTVDLRSGRLRLYLHVLLTGLIVLAGWIWFGNAGAALLALWGKASCPRRQPMTLSIPLAEVCELWLYSMAPRRSAWGERGRSIGKESTGGAPASWPRQ